MPEITTTRLPAKAGQVYSADVLRTVVDTIEFEIEHDGDDVYEVARQVADMHFEWAPQGSEVATHNDLVSNVRRIVPGTLA